MNIKISFKPSSSHENNPFRDKDAFSLLENHNSSSSDLIQDDQKCIDNSRQNKSLYLIEQESNRAKLHVYDTESLKEEVKILNTPRPLNLATCITQLPNGELLCFGLWARGSRKAYIINRNYQVRALPSKMTCAHSSGIYFNNNIYCFGGWSCYSLDFLAVSSKFDFNKNRWIILTSMPWAESYCHCLIFNGNILVSGLNNKNIWLYSIDIDSFSTIPYDFSYEKRKMLIYAEKLYLIESNDGWIYESEDEYNWKQISRSILSSHLGFFQAYWSYNKGGIYLVVSTLHDRDYKCYYKFDLNQKVMTKYFLDYP